MKMKLAVSFVALACTGCATTDDVGIRDAAMEASAERMTTGSRIPRKEAGYDRLIRSTVMDPIQREQLLGNSRTEFTRPPGS